MALAPLWWSEAGGGQKTQLTAGEQPRSHVATCACWRAQGLQTLEPAASSESHEQGGTLVVTTNAACRPESSLS